MSDILFQPLGDPMAAGESLESIADIDPRMTRTHYFDGRLLTAEDLERDQVYLDQRLREVGKVLGHGIISGLRLSYDPFSSLLTLEPGLTWEPGKMMLHEENVVVRADGPELLSRRAPAEIPIIG